MLFSPSPALAQTPPAPTDSEKPPPIDYKMPAELGGPGSSGPSRSPGMIAGGVVLTVVGAGGVGGGLIVLATSSDSLAGPVIGLPLLIGGGAMLTGGIVLISLGSAPSSSALKREMPFQQATLSLGLGMANFRMSF